MIVFQVSSEKNTEIMISDLCFSEESVILRNIQVTMKAFVQPFFNHFSFSLNKKKNKNETIKTCGNEIKEEETKHIHVQLPAYCMLQ